MNLRIWPAVAAALLLASCTQGTQGIFASIEREQKVKSAGGLSSVATVSSMAELPGATPPTSNRYFIAGGGSLFQRSVNETQWHASSITYNGKEYKRFMAVGMVPGAIPSQDTLYAVANQDATDTNLLFSSTDGSTWTAVTLPNGSGTSPVVADGLIPIRKDDGVSSTELLFTVTESSGTNSGAYDAVYIIGTSGIGAQITLPAVQTTGSSTSNAYVAPLLGAAVAHNGTDYYFIGNDGLYYYNASTSPAPTTIVSLSETQGGPNDIKNNGFSDIVLLAPSSGTTAAMGGGSPLNLTVPSGGEQVIISSTKGTIYWGVLNAGNWTYVNMQTGIRDIASEAVHLGKMLYQKDTSPAYMWFGTTNAVTYPGAGFVSLSAADMTVSLQAPSGTDRDNYNSTALPTAEVLMFFRASDGSYYCGTGAQGLWRWGPYPNQTWSQQ